MNEHLEPTKAQRPTRCLRRLVRHRDCETISNNISENLPVTKSELIRLVKWERRNFQKLLDQHNAVRDAAVQVGMILSFTEPPIPKATECLLIISKSLRHGA